MSRAAAAANHIELGTAVKERKREGGNFPHFFALLLRQELEGGMMGKGRNGEMAWGDLITVYRVKHQVVYPYVGFPCLTKLL